MYVELTLIEQSPHFSNLAHPDPSLNVQNMPSGLVELFCNREGRGWEVELRDGWVFATTRVRVLPATESGLGLGGIGDSNTNIHYIIILEMGPISIFVIDILNFNILVQ